MWSTVAALACFFLLDGALFHSGLYNSYVEPNSSSGEVEGHLHWLEQSPPSQHQILVMGDSRIAEGFSARQATATAGGRFHYLNFGIPGASPRVWYYTVRDADPARNRFDAILLQFPQYSDEDLFESAQDRPTDANYLSGRLRYSDCFDFARSFLTPEPAHMALVQCFFRPLALRQDLKEFMLAPSERLKAAADWMARGQGYIDGYGGKPETMAGLSADFQKRTLSFPPGLKTWQTDSARATVFPEPAPQSGLLTQYRQQWLGRIIDLYRGTNTRIVFLETPRAPLPIPEAKTPARFLQSAAARPGVLALPAATFRDLERPEMFADGLHLNMSGRPVFSVRLGERLASLLGTR